MDELKTNGTLQGLTSEEAQQRLTIHGQNLVEEQHPNRWLSLLAKFWSPVPWMLEVTIILQLILHKTDEAIIIAILLIFNALLSFFQEERANKALLLLKQRLAIKARVLRDAHWQFIPAQYLVPGDIVYLRMGDVSPADIRLIKGQLLIDQSSLTGEALPVESKADTLVFSGVMIKRGEAAGEVVATGKNTSFGKTAALLQTAKPVSHSQNVVFTIVKYLITLAIILAVAVVITTFVRHLSFADIIPYILILLVAAIPIALPATFTLATAFGAMNLAKRGVLVTRLLAIEEAAAMEIVCCDKTGTITQNKLRLTVLKPFAAYSEENLLYFAALASDEATQDPLDKAILEVAHARRLLNNLPERIEFVPFDPAYKRAAAIFRSEGKQLHIIKGAPDSVLKLMPNPPDLTHEIEQLAGKGSRVLAVAVGTEEGGEGAANIFDLVGLVAFYDTPREDSAQLIAQLKALGLKILMVTGDTLATAKTVADNVGIGDRVCSSQLFQEKGANILHCDVFAGMFPQDKFDLVHALQKTGRVVGMTGDGVNDAPALKQAEVGIAVSNATDIARAAASIVLTQPGLSGIVSAVEASRRIYQRMLTYILNKIVKSFEIAIFLSLGLILTGNLVITPLLIVLLLFANDFVSMAIATDRVAYSNRPEHWHIGHLMMVGGIMAIFILFLLFSIFFVARDLLHLSLPQLQTLMFVMLVFTGQCNVYLLRERRHFWQSRPGKWLMLASVLDVLIVSLLASYGVLMTPVSPILIGTLLLVIVGYFILIDFVKVRIFSRFNFM